MCTVYFTGAQFLLSMNTFLDQNVQKSYIFVEPTRFTILDTQKSKIYIVLFYYIITDMYYIMLQLVFNLTQNHTWLKKKQTNKKKEKQKQ